MSIILLKDGMSDPAAPKIDPRYPCKWLSEKGFTKDSYQLMLFYDVNSYIPVLHWHMLS